MAIPDQLVEFVKTSLSRSLPRADIEAALLQAGWEREQVNAALASFATTDFPVPVPRPTPYLSAREAFLYLLLFTTLYLSAINFGGILFGLINLALPDPAASGTAAQPESIRGAIRFSVSALVVAFPVFLYLSVLTEREVRRDPGKRASKVRRWLTYLTLFVAATVIIGDLISLINDLLSGDLTLPVTLKALTIGLIAAGVFGYYLRDLRREEKDAAL